MLLRLTTNECWKLLCAIHKAVNNSLANPHQHSEPQLIANLVKKLPDALNRVSLGRGHSLKTGGVFIHAQPLVKCKSFPESNPKSVELGDLLLIRTSIHNNKKVQERRALLLQAKKATQIPTSPGNPNQHHLYANWPSFTYVQSGPTLNGKTRHIKGPNLYSGTKYFLIGKNPVAGELWFAEPSHPKLSAYRCFYQELLDFIIGNTGRQYQKPPPKYTRGWDRVIQDLLKQTAVKVSVYTGRAGTKGKRRGSGVLGLIGKLPERRALAEYLPQTIARTGIGDAGNNDFPPDKEDGDDDGISIIEFVASGKDEAAD